MRQERFALERNAHKTDLRWSYNEILRTGKTYVIRDHYKRYAFVVPETIPNYQPFPQSLGSIYRARYCENQRRHPHAETTLSAVVIIHKRSP